MLIIKAGPEKIMSQFRENYGRQVEFWEQTLYLQDSNNPLRTIDMTIEHTSLNNVIPPNSEIPFTMAALARVEDKVRQKTYYNVGLSSGLTVPDPIEFERIKTAGAQVVLQAWPDEPFQLTKDGKPNGYLQDVTIYDPVSKVGLAFTNYCGKKEDFIDPKKIYTLDVVNFTKAQKGSVAISTGRGLTEWKPSLSQKASANIDAQK